MDCILRVIKEILKGLGFGERSLWHEENWRTEVVHTIRNQLGGLD